MSRGDRWLLVLALGLSAIGLVMVYSSSAILSITRYQDPNYFLSRQLVRVGLGVCVMLACARLRLRWIERLAPWLLGGAVGLLGGTRGGGARLAWRRPLAARRLLQHPADRPAAPSLRRYFVSISVGGVS